MKVNVWTLVVVCSLGCGRQYTSSEFSTGDKQQGSASEQANASTGPELAINRGVQFLLSSLGTDGRWHSPNYGNLRDGAAITCLVLYSLAHVIDKAESRQGGAAVDARTRQKLLKASQQAVDALLPEIQRQGYVSNADGPDYSNYGSAMLLIACDRLDLQLPDKIRQQLIAYLLGAQLDEEEGFQPGSADYGGWDLTGWMTGERPTTGTNISVTATVLEALSMFADREDVKAIQDKARIWIKKCQNENGSFYFHPQRDHDGNKAGWIDVARQRPRGYGTTSADGLRCLAYLGVDANDDSWKRALDWFDQRIEVSRVPGFEHESGEASWGIGLRYYYCLALAKSLSAFSVAQQDIFRKRIQGFLVNHQQTDGAWSNPNARMREDDPIIATCFALIALGKLRDLNGQ